MDYSLGRKNAGLSASALRIWGILFLVLGMVGGVLQNRILGAAGNNVQVLLEKLQNSEMMAATTATIILQALNTCATPIFAFLLIEGFRHTSDHKQYLLRMAGLAVVSEIPYNLVFSGKWLDFGTRNPVFAMAIALVMLFFYRMYAEKSGKNLLIKAIVTLAAMFWAGMLRISDGAPLVILVAVLWMLRDKGMLRLLGGVTAAFVCTLFSYFYIVAIFAFLPVYFYNEEPDETGKWTKYLTYPVLLLVIGVAGKYFL